MKSIILGAAALAALLTSPALAASAKHVPAAATSYTDPDADVRLELSRELFAGGTGVVPQASQPSRNVPDSARSGYAYVPAASGTDANIQLELRREQFN